MALQRLFGDRRREVYRWKVNELLQAGGIGYRLADSGEDQGRLVAIFYDGRPALLADAISQAPPNTATRVQHAIALFRKREATVEDKRSALITLAGILEERRQLGPKHLSNSRPRQAGWSVHTSNGETATAGPNPTARRRDIARIRGWQD
jgi:hypothetical protein